MTVKKATLLLATSVAFFFACSPEQAPPPAAEAGPAGWRDATQDWGLDFVHQTGARGEFHLPEIMGGGVALFDADDDGDADLYFANGNLDPAGGAADATGPRNAFFRNEGGRFVDATAESGLGDAGYGMGLAVGDADGDGDLDVYVANYGRDRLYLNAGRGVFADATEASGIDVGGWSASAAFLDFDADGLLDLFVTGYVRYQPGKRCTDAAGRDDYCGPSVFAPQPDTLLRNVGGGRFVDVTVSSGLSRGIGRGLGVVAFEANGDGWIDLYVANDGDPNHLWIRQPDGRYEDEALLRGVAYNMAGETEAGMGVLAEDLDGNGAWDLFVTHLTEESNTFYAGAGGGVGWADRSAESGLASESLPYTGFGAAAVDLELDGDLDLVVANGKVSGGFESWDGRSVWDRFAEPDLVFRNDGGGRFVTAPLGSRGVSRGIAVADLDQDGDADWVVSSLQGPARVWINEPETPGHWLAVDAPRGSTVRLDAGGVRRVRRCDPTGAYLSSGEPLARFGLGDLMEVESLTVRFPDGRETKVAVPGVDRVLKVAP